jgi:hypothetical protein
MRKSLMALSAAAVIGAASLAAPSPAQAHAWWIVPAIVGGVIVGGVAAAAASQPYPYGPYYGPAYYRGDVSVRPTCRIVRERAPGGWRRYEVCR